MKCMAALPPHNRAFVTGEFNSGRNALERRLTYDAHVVLVVAHSPRPLRHPVPSLYFYFELRFGAARVGSIIEVAARHCCWGFFAAVHDYFIIAARVSLIVGTAREGSARQEETPADSEAWDVEKG